MPAGMTFSIEENVTATLDEISKRALDMSTIIPIMGQIGLESVLENFDAEGRPEKWKERKIPVMGKKILRISGEMERSTSWKTLNKESFGIINNSDYGAIHNFGFKGTISIPPHQRTITMAFGRPVSERQVNVKGHKRKVDMPQREFMIIQDDATDEMTATVADYTVPEDKPRTKKSSG